MMAAKKIFLNTADRYWRVEHGFWTSLTGDVATRAAQKKILEALPTESHDISLAASDKQLLALAESKLVEFMGLAVKTIVTTVHGYVQSLLNSRAPSLDKLIANSEFTLQVKSRLAFFCKWETPSSPDEMPQSFVGTKAAGAWLEHLSAMHTAGSAVSWKDISTVLSFAWLLSGEQLKAATKLKNQIVSNNDAASTAAASTRKSEGGRKAGVDTKAMVKALFTN